MKLKIAIAVLIWWCVGCGGASVSRCEVATAIRRGAQTVEQAAEIAEEYACDGGVE